MPLFFSTPPPKYKSLAHQYTPATAIIPSCIPYIHQSCSFCSLTLSQTFATTKAGSDMGVAQILTFIIYKIFHKKKLEGKCGLYDTSDIEIFFWCTYIAWI